MRSGERKGNAGKAAKRKRQMLKVPRTKTGGKVHREKERDRRSDKRMHCNITWESYYEKKCKDLKRRKLKQVVNYIALYYDSQFV